MCDLVLFTIVPLVRFMLVVFLVFDVIKFVVPCLRLYKLICIIQDLDGTEWDSTPPFEITTNFQKFKIELPLLFSFCLPRFVKVRKSKSIQFMGFVDAS